MYYHQIILYILITFKSGNTEFYRVINAAFTREAVNGLPKDYSSSCVHHFQRAIHLPKIDLIRSSIIEASHRILIRVKNGFKNITAHFTNLANDAKIWECLGCKCEFVFLKWTSAKFSQIVYGRMVNVQLGGKKKMQKL